MRGKVDSREPPEIKVPLEVAGFEVVALKAGDFELPEAGGGVVVIERKTLSQLLQDMREGQLQRQARALADASPFPLLLIEGHWRTDGNMILGSNYSWEQVWNQLATLQDLGCRIQLTQSIRHTTQRIAELAMYYQKDQHTSVGRHLSGDSRVSTLSNIQGVSSKKAKSILAVFPTLADVASAEVEQLERVDGIGPKLAKEIYSFWRRG